MNGLKSEFQYRSEVMLVFLIHFFKYGIILGVIGAAGGALLGFVFEPKGGLLTGSLFIAGGLLGLGTAAWMSSVPASNVVRERTGRYRDLPF